MKTINDLEGRQIKPWLFLAPFMNRFGALLAVFAIETIVSVKTAPLAFPQYVWGKEANGLLFPIENDTFFYLGRVISLSDGNLTLQNPFMSHDSLGFGSYTFFGDYLLSGFYLITKSLNFAYFLDVSFKVLIALYVLNKCLKMFMRRHLPWSTLLILLILWRYPVWFVRPVNPSTGLTLFLLFIYSFLKRLTSFSEVSRLNSFEFLMSLSSFLLWLTYPHLAVITTIATCIMFVRELMDVKKPKMYVFPTLSSILGFFVWFSMSFFPHSQEKVETLWRVGEISSRMPGGIRESASGLIAVTFFMILRSRIVTYRKFGDSLSYLILCSLAGMNIQIITGKYGENAAHAGTAIYLLSGLLIVFTSWNVIQEYFLSRSIQIAAIGFCCVLTVTQGLGGLESLSQLDNQRILENYLNIKKLTETIQNRKLTSLAAPVQISSQIPLYSKTKVLYSYEGSLIFPMSNQELLERWVLNDFLQGNKSISPDIGRIIFPRHFVNLEARFTFDSEQKDLQLQKELDFWYLQAKQVLKSIEFSPSRYLEKYSVQAIVYASPPKSENYQYESCLETIFVKPFKICLIDLRKS